MTTELYDVYPYTAPEWARQLLNIPKQYVKLSNLDTPIHEWRLPSVPPGYKICIKRDDLTGTELSGNKVRCLQLFFAEALSEGAKHVVTGGGPQSGHCRAVSLVSRTLGLQPHLVLVGVKRTEDLGSKGNALLFRLAGSQIYLAPYESFKRRLYTMQTHISDKYNEPCYCIPLGGTSVKGVYGFISLFQELLDQGLHERFDDLVVTIGTGATATGLAVGNYLTGNKLGIHAVTVGFTKEVLMPVIDEIIHALGLTNVKTEDVLDIIEGYVEAGYGTTTEELLEFMAHVSSTTGILLDTCYTGKGAMGLATELNKNPSRFRGKRILFIHTGGIFNLFNGQMDRLLDKQGSVTNNITAWPCESLSPLM